MQRWFNILLFFLFFLHRPLATAKSDPARPAFLKRTNVYYNIIYSCACVLAVCSVHWRKKSKYSSCIIGYTYIYNKQARLARRILISRQRGGGSALLVRGESRGKFSSFYLFFIFIHIMDFTTHTLYDSNISIYVIKLHTHTYIVYYVSVMCYTLYSYHVRRAKSFLTGKNRQLDRRSPAETRRLLLVSSTAKFG